MMIRIDADERFTEFSAGGASQGTLSQDVKEDLKKNFFTSLKNISQNQSLDEQQIYGLTCICGNNAVTLPILKNLRTASEKIEYSW